VPDESKDIRERSPEPSHGAPAVVPRRDSNLRLRLRSAFMVRLNALVRARCRWYSTGLPLAGDGRYSLDSVVVSSRCVPKPNQDAGSTNRVLFTDLLGRVVPAGRHEVRVARVVRDDRIARRRHQTAVHNRARRRAVHEGDGVAPRDALGGGAPEPVTAKVTEPVGVPLSSELDVIVAVKVVGCH
jgi:hypothetical protein